MRRQPVRCLCTPHKRTLFGEGKVGVQPRLFCILCQGVWGLSGCGGSLYPYQLLGRSRATRPGQAVYSQNRDGYGVQGMGGDEVGVKV